MEHQKQQAAIKEYFSELGDCRIRIGGGAENSGARPDLSQLSEAGEHGQMQPESQPQESWAG
jgi:hypothetical protein